LAGAPPCSSLGEFAALPRSLAGFETPLHGEGRSGGGKGEVERDFLQQRIKFNVKKDVV